MTNKIITALVCFVLMASPVSGSLFFNDPGEQVDHGSGISMGSSFTVMAWIKPNNVDATVRHLGGQDQSTGRLRFQTGDPSGAGELTLFIVGTANDNFRATSNSGTLIVDIWQIVVWRFVEADAQECRLYIGDLDTPLVEVGYSDVTTGSGMLSTSGNPLIIGRDSAANFPFEGDIASVIIWPLTALTIEQMRIHQWNFRPQIAGSELYVQYGFNGAGTQADWSGSANNGTVTGATQSDHVPLGAPFGG